MRQGGYGDKIELLVDNVQDLHKALPLRLKEPARTKPVDDDEDDIAAAWVARDDAMGDLALERGEKPGQVSKASNELVKDLIAERTSSNAPPQAPSLPSQTSEQTMAIEGHVPRIDKKDREDDDDDDEDAQDWDKHLPG